MMKINNENTQNYVIHGLIKELEKILSKKTDLQHQINNYNNRNIFQKILKRDNSKNILQEYNNLDKQFIFEIETIITKIINIYAHNLSLSDSFKYTSMIINNYNNNKLDLLNKTVKVLDLEINEKDFLSSLYKHLRNNININSYFNFDIYDCKHIEFDDMKKYILDFFISIDSNYEHIIKKAFNNTIYIKNNIGKSNFNNIDETIILYGNNLESLITYAHECGHYLAYELNKEKKSNIDYFIEPEGPLTEYMFLEYLNTKNFTIKKNGINKNINLDDINYLFATRYFNGFINRIEQDNNYLVLSKILSNEKDTIDEDRLKQLIKKLYLSPNISDNKINDSFYQIYLTRIIKIFDSYVPNTLKLKYILNELNINNNELIKHIDNYNLENKMYESINDNKYVFANFDQMEVQLRYLYSLLIFSIFKNNQKSKNEKIEFYKYYIENLKNISLNNLYILLKKDKPDNINEYIKIISSDFIMECNNLFQTRYTINPSVNKLER